MTYVKNFQPGDRVLWQYEHTIGRNRFYRIKVGTIVRRKYRRWGTGPGRNKHWANEFIVLFDGNKSTTVVHENDMRHEKVTRDIYKRGKL